MLLKKNTAEYLYTKYSELYNRFALAVTFQISEKWYASLKTYKTKIAIAYSR